MKVLWTEGASEDLTQIVDYIGQSSEDAARRVAKAIYDRTVSLESFPRMGRRRGAENTYELLSVPWPYLVIYEIVGDGIFIEGIIHTSRDRPL